jgi:hypothetical protein
MLTKLMVPAGGRAVPGAPPREIAQLLVVALMLPSLYVLSRTAAYGLVRGTVALIGVVLSAGWLLERTTLLDEDPFARVSTALVEHPFTVAAAFALLALAAQRSANARPVPGAEHGSYPDPPKGGRAGTALTGATGHEVHPARP